MKQVLFAVLFFAPALLAAEPPPPPHNDPPEVVARLKQEAAALEQQALANPKDTETFVRLGFTYARLKQADDAQRAFETAVSLDPKKAVAHYMLGLIYEKKGMRDRAITAWKACLENATDPQMRDTAERHLHHLNAIK
jgi:cytochrome c-type biogenesis protein CcmH/NrfG